MWFENKTKIKNVRIKSFLKTLYSQNEIKMKFYRPIVITVYHNALRCRITRVCFSENLHMRWLHALVKQE